MPSNVMQIVKVSDRELLEFCTTAAKILQTEEVHVSIFGGGPEQTYDRNDERLGRFSDSSFGAINSVRIVKSPYYIITLQRGQGSNSEQLIYDTLRIDNVAEENGQPQHALAFEVIKEVQELVEKTFSQDQESISVLFKNPKLFRDLLASHHRQNVQLQKTVLDIGKNAASARISLEEEFAKRRRQLENDAHAAEFERQKALEARLEAVRAEDERLQALQKEIDDRNNTHARRELHRDLKAKISQRAGSMKVTPETIRNRTPIHIATCLAVASMLGLILWLSAQAASMPSGLTSVQYLIAGIKPALLTVAMLGLIAWYLRWMNRWFERYADAEFQLKQFELDIDRASWVVEAALEWKLSQDRPMPEHLLETISRNLFSKSEADDASDMHPADYLASAILGRASALNLKMPGGELSLTGKDIQRLKND
jgi:hypothetical protein